MENKLFWGLVVEQGKQYKQTPQYNFHVSMAVLDLKTADSEPVSVYVQVETGEFILCNLTKTQPQVHLDLIFSEGEKIKFYTTGGKGSVHMTGFVMPEDDFGDMMEDEEFSDEEVSIDSDLAEPAQNAKRKNTETLKLTGKDAKKLKTNDNKVAEKQKVVDIDPKQLLNNSKKPQDKPEVKKPQQAQANQLKAKPQANAKLALKPTLEEDSDDDLSLDEDEESVDLNNLNKLMDEDDSDLDDLVDEDLESDDDDLGSDDEEDLAKLKQMKNKAGKPNQLQTNKQAAGAQLKPFEKPPHGKQNQQGKPFQKQQNGQNFNKNQNNKTPQNQNKSNQNTPHQKSNQKHQQTPFNKNAHQNSNKKGGNPFNRSGNKSFGSQNKPKKVFS